MGDTPDYHFPLWRIKNYKMDKHQLLDLIFQSYNSFQTVWGIYTTVTLGLLAAVVSFPKQFNSILARVIIIIGFLFFTGVNRMALLKLVNERCELRVEAYKKFDVPETFQKYNCGYGVKQLGINVDKMSLEETILFKALDPTQRMLVAMNPSTPFQLKVFHGIQSLLLVLIVWFVPRQLVRLKPNREIIAQRVRIKNSKLPNPLISFNTTENMWELKKDIIIEQMYLNGEKLKIQEGFLFDLASIPRPLWTLIAPFELSIIAPLVHDFLYVNKGQLFIKNNIISDECDECKPFQITREQADSIFLSHMRDENIGKIKSHLAFQAVNLFGWIYWKEDETRHNKA